MVGPRRGRAARATAIDDTDDSEVAAAEVAAAVGRRSRLREQPREAVRTSPRGATEAIGRDGQVLSRTRTTQKDIFDIPLELIPRGWEYQWCAVTVTGNSEILLDQNLMFAENGWRPVPCERYPGRFMPAGHKGSIIRGQQMMMERPKVLSDEARAEDIANARQQMSDRNESLKLAVAKKNMGDGFEMSRKYRGTGTDIRMSIDPALDAPAPAHQLDIE